MALGKPVIFDGSLQRQIQRGDILAGAETFTALTTVGAGTLSAALLLSNLLTRTGPTGAYTDTTDTAANIVQALIGAGYGNSINNGLSSGLAIQNGTTFRLRYINTVAFAMTLAAGTGVTLGSNTGISASSVKDYLLTVLNGTAVSTANASTVSGSAVVTGMSQFATAQLSVGETITGTGFSGNPTIISVQQGIGFTASANAGSTNPITSLTFSPSIRIDSLGQMLL